MLWHHWRFFVSDPKWFCFVPELRKPWAGLLSRVKLAMNDSTHQQKTSQSTPTNGENEWNPFCPSLTRNHTEPLIASLSVSLSWEVIWLEVLTEKERDHTVLSILLWRDSFVASTCRASYGFRSSTAYHLHIQLLATVLLNAQWWFAKSAQSIAVGVVQIGEAQKLFVSNGSFCLAGWCSMGPVSKLR